MKAKKDDVWEELRFVLDVQEAEGMMPTFLPGRVKQLSKHEAAEMALAAAKALGYYRAAQPGGTQTELPL